VAARINGIYQSAQDRVKRRLADLETQSMKRFDEGNAKATQTFESNVNRELEAYKDDRYSGWFGWARKAKDWLLGMDDLPQVKAIFERNRASFVTAVNQLVADISADNKRVIQECKAELAGAKAAIKEYVDALGPSLKDIGKKTASEVNGKLEELDGFIRKKEEELQQALADKQQAAIKAIDEKIEKMKEAMAGALAKLGKLLLWAAKKLFTWALGKFGYSLSEIEGIISKGVAVLKAIFTKPIVFVKNLMNAAITGFQNFKKNFFKHLKDALFEWLTGSLQGLVLPTSWDFKGIVGLALQMIGISYRNIRAHMVTVMGEPVVAGLEKGFSLVRTLVTEGPMAAWEQLKEMASEMRDAFIQAVKDFIKSKIIEQAIQWVVSLFIPGAGLIKAVIGIYDTVVFFIQKAKQIAKMVGNFLGSIGEIAAGNIGAAAEAMENGLARGLSLVISFLAQLLHLNGITAKIRDAIQKIRDKVDTVLLKVANWIADKAKKLFGAVKTGARKLIEWWKKRTPFKTAAGASHEVYFTGDDKKAVPMVASKDPQPIAKKLAEYATLAKDAGASEPQKKALPLIQKVTGSLTKKMDDSALVAGIVTDMKTLFDVFDEAGGPKKTTKLEFQQSNWGGSSVATRMTIDWLDKKYASKHGGPPKASALGAVMGKLTTDPGENSEDKYVKGHLLNENLGGQGDESNLFPITAIANSRHLHSTETKIKGWISKPNQWVWYEVKVDEVQAEFPKPKTKSKLNFIDATFNCYAVLKDESGKKLDGFLTTIHSKHAKRPEASRFEL
jgi:hypothetical protein